MPASVASGRGAFFALEGLDGSGKSTQAARLGEALRTRGYDVVSVRDPGGTDLSAALREILLHGKAAIAPEAELCLYAASRAQLVSEIIAPALRRGAVVITDRFTWSAAAYQGHGRGLPMEAIRALERLTCGEALPDAVYFLDLPVDRMGRRLEGKAADRLESEAPAFFERVREGFLAAARRQPDQSLILDAMASESVLAERILAHAVEKLQELGLKAKFVIS